MNNRIKSGVLGIIIAIDTNHHITFVAQEIVSLVRSRALQDILDTEDA